MNAKEYLSQALNIDRSINSKLEQVASLHELATKATTLMSDMPGSPNRNIHKMEVHTDSLSVAVPVERMLMNVLPCR